MKRLTLNAGTGMALGALGAVLVGFLVQAVTGDRSIWQWIMPIGIAMGVALGAGHERMQDEAGGK